MRSKGQVEGKYRIIIPGLFSRLAMAGGIDSSNYSHYLDLPILPMNKAILSILPAKVLRLPLLALIGSLAIASHTQASSIIIGYDLDSIGPTVEIPSPGVPPSPTHAIPFQLPGTGLYTIESASFLVNDPSGRQDSYAAGIDTDGLIDSSFSPLSPLYSFSLVSALFVGDGKLVFTPDAPLQLLGGTTYYLKLRGLGINEYFRDPRAPSGAPAGTSTTGALAPVTGLLGANEGYDSSVRYINSGSQVHVDYANGSQAGAFSIAATAVPEAGTAFSILGAGAFFLGFGLRRRRPGCGKKSEKV